MAGLWTIGRWALVAALTVLAGCGGVPHMREAEPGELLSAPPAGKVLVNFNRDSGYGGHRVYAFFDGTRFVGCNKGAQRVQYVCEPGQHVFIGYLTSSIWATVSVVDAELLPDKVYDCIVDIGYFTAMIAMNPLKRGDARRGRLADWDEDQDTLVLDPEGRAVRYEAEQAETNQKILDEHKTKERDPAKVLAPDDHRD
ncbi:MAG: hypothetical protein AB7N76_12855 [Planctomycetota bacterium]